MDRIDRIRHLEAHRQRLEQIVGLLSLTITDFYGGDPVELIRLAEERIDDPQPVEVDRLLRRVKRVPAGTPEPDIEQPRFLALLRGDA